MFFSINRERALNWTKQEIAPINSKHSHDAKAGGETARVWLIIHHREVTPRVLAPPTIPNHLHFQ
jgi:hypothetical protein